MAAYSFVFSKVYDIALFPFLHRIRKRVSSDINLQAPQKIIDLCCGTGNQLGYLNKQSKNETIGVDISENMLAVASKKKLNCYHLDATNTSFSDNDFDVAILSFILHETSHENAMKIAAEAKRIVKSNGRIVVVDYMFDNKTSVFGKFGVNAAEFLMGKVHFGNFKSYIKNEYLKHYVRDLEMFKSHRYLFGAVCVNTYINHKKPRL